MFDVYYNEKKNWFEFKSGKQDITEAIYGFNVGVAFHTPDGGVHYLRFNETKIGSILITKPAFLAPGAVIFMDEAKNNEICFEINGITYYTLFKLNGKLYKAMHDSLVSIIKKMGIELSDMCF